MFYVLVWEHSSSEHRKCRDRKHSRTDGEHELAAVALVLALGLFMVLVLLVLVLALM